MYSRLIAAVLRLLPGSSYQSPDNPLQVDRLPDISKVELDYPVYQSPPAVIQRQTLITICVTAATASLLGWVSQRIPIPLLHGGLNTIGLLAAATMIVLGIFAAKWPTFGWLLAAVSVIVLSSLVREVPFSLSALIFAILALPFFANSLATHFLYLKTAAPMSGEMSRLIRDFWKARWFRPWRSPPGSEFYPVNFLILIPSAWLLLKHLAEEPGFEGATKTFFQVALLGLLWGGATDAIFAFVFRRRTFFIHRQLVALWHAVVEWATYNRLNTHGAGVHQSPAGTCTVRKWFFVGMILSWACVWVGSIGNEPPVTFDDLMAKQLKILNRLTEEVEKHKKSDADKIAERRRERDLPTFSASELAQLRAKSPADAEEYIQRRREELERKFRDEDAAEVAHSEGKVYELLSKFVRRLASVLLQVFVPFAATLSAIVGLCTGMIGRTLAGVEDMSDSNWRERVFTTNNWPNLVDRIQASGDETEKNSVLLGTNARDDSPVLVHRDVFREHAHILGDSGSGKTSMGILPLLSQLMRRGDCSVVVVDLKADDQLLFECLRDESARITERVRRANRYHPTYDFRWFTTVVGRSSYAFNPLRQAMMKKLTPDQRTDLLQAALGLHYGNDYGRKFYGDANFEVLNFALRNFPEVDSFTALERVLDGSDRFPLHAESKKAGSNVRSSIRRLARFEALNASPANGTPDPVLNASIDLDDLFTTPQALYVALPPAAGISTTAEIARIFLYSLLATAQAHTSRQHQVFLVVDEFQRIVAKNIELFLQQARSMNIGCILSNQSLADLESVDADLVDAVRTNTRFRQVFGAGSRGDIYDLMDTAGETIFGLRSWSFVPSLFTFGPQSMSVSEGRHSRLSLNDILLATDAPGRNIACVRRGMGFAQYGGMAFVMDSVYHLADEHYRSLSKSSWPPQEKYLVSAKLEETKANAPIVTPRVLEDPPPGPAENPEPQPEEKVSASQANGDEADPMEEFYLEQLQAHDALQKKFKKALRRRRPGA